MRITFFGVRGSTPCHGHDIVRYGGNTSCVAVDVPGEPPLFFDLGTGVRNLGRIQPHDGSFRGTCLLSHLHWDHLQGLPFFTPLLRPGSILDVYGPAQGDGVTVEEAVRGAISPPVFPVGLDAFPGSVRFHDLADADFELGAVHVMARLVPHLGPTLGYRVEWNGRSVAYLSDHQQPHDGSFRVADGARALAEGADLLIHDAQFTPDEFAAKREWGHCTMQYAAWLAAECGVRTLALFHHDPSRTDDALDEAHREIARSMSDDGLTVVTAREGLTIDLT